MRREDKKQGIITLRHNDGTDSWLVVRRVMMDADQVSSSSSSGGLGVLGRHCLLRVCESCMSCIHLALNLRIQCA